MAADEQQIFAQLQELGPIVAYPAVRAPQREQISPAPVSKYVQAMDATGLLLALEGRTDWVRLEEKELSGKTLWGISAMDSCVIGYDRGLPRGRELPLSNLYAYLTRLEGGTVVDKDPEFREWCKRVFSIVRRETPRWHKFKSYRATEAAFQAQTLRGIELVDY